MSIQFFSPVDGSKLEQTKEGYQDKGGNVFPIENGIPNFVYPKELPASDLFSLEWYKRNADDYDAFLPLTFETFNVSEEIERNKMLDALEIEPNHKILEIGAGTGRDSVRIASKLGKEGELFLSDISYDIFKYAVEKFEKSTEITANTQLFLANGYQLPFADHSFDRVFHFGGINTFGDVKKAFKEMVRVCKSGGRIVIGDENMPIWLRESEFGQVLMNSNPLYKDFIPFESLPVEARNVKVEWFIGGVFYFMSFDVGEGEPYANLDFEIPGIRGGTHRTRYYGNLEGITPETIDLIKKARAKSGKSMHKWLDDTLKEMAEKELGD